MPEYDEWDRIEPNPSYDSRPGVDHTCCTQMNGVCIGWHCSNCGEASSSQGHFGRCDPEAVRLHQEWKEERARAKAALVPTGEEIATGLAPGFDALLTARLGEEFAKLAETHIERGEN